MTKLFYFFCNNYGTFIYCFATYFQEVSAGVLLKVATKCYFRGVKTLKFIVFNSLQPGVAFLYRLKTSENLEVFTGL